MANTQHHVSLRNLTHTFQDGRRFLANGRSDLKALADVSLEIAWGQFVTVIGPSGCGKSTLLRVIGGLLHPTSGEALIDGAPPSHAQRRRDIGLVFQDPSLLPWRTVMGNVRLPLEIDRSARRRPAPSPEELLDLTGLSEFAGYYPHELSGGMQQRVAIARALAFDPSLLLMDEPFGALDEITRSAMRYELLRIWQTAPSGRKTVVFVTHSIAEAVALSDRVVVLSPRPGAVRATIDIELARPRTQEMERTAPFLDYADHMRSLLKEATA